jgi:hypothetical protein
VPHGEAAVGQAAADTSGLVAALVSKASTFASEVLRNFEGFGIAVRREEAGHTVVGEVDSVWALVDEDGNRRIGSRVRYVLHHFFHDERISGDEAEAARRRISGLLAQDFAQVEASKLHQPRWGDRSENGLLHGGEVFRCSDLFLKSFHVRMADGGLKGGDDVVEGAWGLQAEALHRNFFGCHGSLHFAHSMR